MPLKINQSEKLLNNFEIRRMSSVLLAHADLRQPWRRVFFAQEKKTFTQFLDIKPGRSVDALLNVFQPISDNFGSEFQALGTAFSAGEILYEHKALRRRCHSKFRHRPDQGKRYPYLYERRKTAWPRRCDGGRFGGVLRLGREIGRLPESVHRGGKPGLTDRPRHLSAPAKSTGPKRRFATC